MGVMLMPKYLRPANEIALITAGGLLVSAFAWFRSGVVAVIAILCATLVADVADARRLDIKVTRELSRARVREMYENSPDRIACLGDDGSVLYTNLHHVDGDKSTDTAPEAPCYSLLYNRTESCEECAFEPVHDGGVAHLTQSEIVEDGTVHWFSKTLYPVNRHDGTTESVVEIARDVTELHDVEAALLSSTQDLEAKIARRTVALTESNRKLIQEIAAREAMSGALRESESRFRQLIDGSPDMIILHSEGRIDLVNPAGVRLLGADSADSVIGSVFTSLWDGDGVRPSTAGSHGAGIGESADSGRVLGLRRLDGGRVDVEMSESLALLDGRIHVQCVIRDITESVRAREAIHRLAYFDSLTGLPNRALFDDRLHTALAGVRRTETLLAVAFVDIDDFSRVNDTWGHDVGDTVMVQFAERVSCVLREQDTVARYGSDEFALLAELNSPAEADSFARRLRSGLTPAFHVGGREITLTASIGITATNGHGVRPEELLRHADQAMRTAKLGGPGNFKVDSMDSQDHLASLKPALQPPSRRPPPLHPPEEPRLSRRSLGS
jgi:diguanylate cyclase (GGDEF)-like protein/PAS domain S-box-containing protein